VGLALLLVLFSVLGARLVQLQGLDASRYTLLAEQQRVRTVTLTGPRGQILDREGEALALSVDAKAVYADPHEVTEPAQTAAALAPLLRRPVAELLPKLTRKTRFVYLARGLDPATADRVRTPMAGRRLAGIGKLPESRRVHPGRDLAANLVGYTGQDGRGMAGIESQYDEVLAGRDGKRLVEVAHGGQRIPSGQLLETPAASGRDVQLTISRDLQYMAQSALADGVRTAQADRGSVVAMDVRSGEVLALASVPTFDAQNPGASEKEDRGNLPLAGVFEPGSTNKVITAAAALDAGLVTPDTVLSVPGSIRIADKAFSDAHDRATEQMTFTGVLAKSSNVGTIMVGQQLGRQRLYDALRAFGFGARTGVDFPGESAGILPTPKNWSGTSDGTIPIGQGVSVTALQIASVYQTLANGGVRVEPSLVRGTRGADGVVTPTDPIEERRVVSSRAAEQVLTMLEAVTTEEGTAPKAAIPGYRVAGKTGTAYRVDPACGCYRGYVASFIGVAPADEPRFVVAVAVDNPRAGYYGGQVAAPVFQDVMSFALRQSGVAPTGRKAPVLRLAPS